MLTKAVKKVLLADDEEIIRRVIAATLGGSEEYDLILARDGEEALRLAKAERPNLIFLDVRMPKKDGYQVCRELKQDPATAGIKVVMLTAMVLEADRERGRLAGADDYLAKPFSPTALLEKVEELLGLV